MKRILPLLIATLFILNITGASAYTERNLLRNKMGVDQLKKVLIPHQGWVKYPKYRDRAGWDALTGNKKQDLIKNGEKVLDYVWQVVTATDYLEYERSGSRDAMQNPYGANNNALSDLVMAELAEGKGRFLDQIINGVWHSCDMSSWVLSAHLAAYQKSKRSLADPEETVIDLTSGDLGSMLSWTWYFLKDEMDRVNPVISHRLRNELQKRILDSYMQRSDFWWQAFNATPQSMVNNWNPWCNFNVLTCFLLLENNPDKLAEAVYRTMESVDKFINYNHDDGACEEGPSYWGHAAGKLYDYLQILYDATGSKLSVFNESIIKNMGEYIDRSYIGDGWVVNFADASARGGGDKGVIFRYGKAVNSPEMEHFAAYLLQQDGHREYKSNGLDIFRSLETLTCYPEMVATEPKLPEIKFSWYPQTEFCYMRNQTGFFFAAKGGYNNESHNHNDVGSFLLYLNNKPVFIDAGVGTYTRQTFSNERYKIWTMQSNYHNLPVINGKAQEFGTQYRSGNVTCEEKKHRFSLNIAGAYQADAGIKYWNRSYSLQPDGGLTIEDSFSLAEVKDANRVNFMTQAEPELSVPGKVLYKIGDKKVQLSYDGKIFKPAVERIEQTDSRLSNVWGKTLYRLTLISTGKQLKGLYKFTVNIL